MYCGTQHDVVWVQVCCGALQTVAQCHNLGTIHGGVTMATSVLSRFKGFPIFLLPGNHCFPSTAWHSTHELLQLRQPEDPLRTMYQVVYMNTTEVHNILPRPCNPYLNTQHFYCPQNMQRIKQTRSLTYFLVAVIRKMTDQIQARRIHTA